ncbi:MAG: CRTAC1 family protein [Candidatus Limnocylindrales bacterium]
MPASADHRARRRSTWLAIAAVVAVLAGSAVVIAALAIPAMMRGVTPTAALGAPRFIEEAEAAGLDHSYEGEFAYFVGGGVAAFDCDDDGRPDLYLAGGSRPAALFRNTSPVGGALRFEPQADPDTDLDAVTGAYPLDIDSDGILDLAVLRLGENVLLRGTGDCGFERANEAWGFDGGEAWTTAFSATWEAGASWPTLAFGNYYDEAFTDPGDLCQDNAVVRPAVSAAGFGPPSSLGPSWCALSMLFSDWGRTGQRDLRVSNDQHYYAPYTKGEEQLWRFSPGRPPVLYTRDDGWQLQRIWGMGIASQDLDGDGKPEIYLTNQGDNRLQTLIDGATGPDYRDIALATGVTAHRPYTGDDDRRSTAWHAEFQDVNNDGWMDLFVAKGNVEVMPDYAWDDPSNLLMGQPDGTFVEGGEAAGIVDYARGRGAAVIDLNLDGLLDIVEVKRRENVRLWRSLGAGSADASQAAPMGHWAAVKLEQPAPNTDAIGAWVAVKVGDRIIERELTVGGGHVSGQLGWIHFGLGPADRAEVRVQWPDGEVGPWLPLTADGFSIIDRGADAVRSWTPDGE